MSEQLPTRFTVRVDGDQAYVSTDDGKARQVIDSGAVGLVRAAIENAAAVPSRLSAVALGTVAEATANEPRPHEDAAGATDTVLPADPTPIALPTAAGTAFTALAARRRSVRQLGPITLSGLAAVLTPVFQLAAFGTADDGAVMRYRPAPSAGARHPVVPVVLAHDVAGLDSGMWRLDADGQSLYHCPAATNVLDEAWATVLDVTGLTHRPGAAIVLAVDAWATLSRYPAGISLVWRDAGAAAAMLTLAATDASIGSCIAGTAGLVPEDTLRAAGLHGYLVTDMGTVVLGVVEGRP